MPGHHAARVGQVAVEVGLVPGQARILHRLAELEARRPRRRGRPRCRPATGRCRSCRGSTAVARLALGERGRLGRSGGGRWRPASGSGSAFRSASRRGRRLAGSGSCRIGRGRACRPPRASSSAAGSSASSAPPPQAASANRTGASAAADFGANFIEASLRARWPAISAASYRRIERTKRPRSRLVAPAPHPRAKLPSPRRRLLSHATSRAYPGRLMFEQSPSTWRDRARRHPAPRGAAGGRQPAADAGLRDRRDLRRPARRAGARRLEPVDRAVRPADVVLLGPDRDGRRADRRRARPPPPRGARGPPQRAHGAVAGGGCAGSSAWRCAGSGARSCCSTGQDPAIAATGRRVPARDHVGDDPDDLRQRAAQRGLGARPAALRDRDHRARGRRQRARPTTRSCSATSARRRWASRARRWRA